MIIQSMATRSLISGDTLNIPYYTWEGGDGPSVYIQAGIHGQEYMGYGVALCLIDYFKANPPKGRVTIVPKANSYGMNVKMGDTTYGRFDPTTGANWNRNYYNWLQDTDVEAFVAAHNGQPWGEVKQVLRELGVKVLQHCHSRESGNPGGPQDFLGPRLRGDDTLPYANKLARQLQALAIQHDIMLDLHCDAISLPYVYCHDYALENAKQLGFPYYFTMHRYFKGSFDDATIYPFWTVFEQMGFEGALDMDAYTLELGNKEYFDLEKCGEFAEKIIGFLTCHPGTSAQPEVSGSRIAPVGRFRDDTVVRSCHQNNFLDIHSPVAGMVYDFVPLGQTVPAGQPLCYILQTHNEDCAVKDRILPITYHRDCTPIAHTPAGAVHEGVGLVSVII